MLKQTFWVFSFFTRHLVASIVSILLPVILTMIGYVVLFIIALFTDSGLGSPAALPLWMIINGLIATLYTGLGLFPIVVIAEIVSHVFGKWRHVAQIPVSTVLMFGLVFLLFAIFVNSPNQLFTAPMDWTYYALIVSCFLALPLGIYWWTMKLIEAGIFLPVFLFKKLSAWRNFSEA